MGYTMVNGQWANVEDVILNPTEGTLTVDGYSSELELGYRGIVRLTLDVTSVSAADTLDVTIHTSADGVTWYTSGTFTQATGATSERKIFAIDRYVRAHFNVTGSDVSIVCTLTGEAA